MPGTSLAFTKPRLPQATINASPIEVLMGVYSGSLLGQP